MVDDLAAETRGGRCTERGKKKNRGHVVNGKRI